MNSLLIGAFALAVAAPANAGHALKEAPQRGAHRAGQDGHAVHAKRTAQAQHEGEGQALEHSKHANCCGSGDSDERMDCCEAAQAGQRPCCEKHAVVDKARPAEPK